MSSSSSSPTKFCLHQNLVVAISPPSSSSSSSSTPPKIQCMQHMGHTHSPQTQITTSMVHELLLPSNFLAHDLCLSQDMLAVWSLQEVRLYQLSSSFSSSSSLSFLAALTMLPAPLASVALSGRSLLVALAQGNKVDIYHDLSSSAPAPFTPSTSLPFSEKEGHPMHMDIHGHFLAIATDKHVLKLFDLRKMSSSFSSNNKKASAPPPQRGSAGLLKLENEEDSGILVSIRVNADGSRVSFVLSSLPSQLCLYDVHRDMVQSHDLGAPLTAHVWDEEDPKLLVCTTTTTTQQAREDDSKTTNKKEKVITHLVSPDDAAVTRLDEFVICPPLLSLVGVCVPKLYFSSSTSTTTASSSLLSTRTMRDFVGLEYDALDPPAQAALKEFHYHLLTENWHAAHQTIKLLRSQKKKPQLLLIWQNMARLCLHTRRVDIAELCLGHMGHVRGLTAVREAASASSSSIDVTLAMVAIQLGLLEEAVSLYQKAGRWDLIRELYQAAGRWKEALAVAETNDRFHRRNTHFQYARHMESLGEYTEAMHHYEQAEAHAREVPRMLFQAGKVDELQVYISSSTDPMLWRWWGAYCESKRDVKGAKAWYEKAHATVDIVRLACVEQDVATAEAVVKKTGCKAAAYHLARHFEGALHDVYPALAYYAQAGCFHHCLRLAMVHELDGEVMTYALQSDKEGLMLQSARYFSQRGMQERAQELLHKAAQKAARSNIHGA